MVDINDPTTFDLNYVYVGDGELMLWWLAILWWDDNGSSSVGTKDNLNGKYII